MTASNSSNNNSNNGNNSAGKHDLIKNSKWPLSSCFMCFDFVKWPAVWQMANGRIEKFVNCTHYGF